MYNEMVRQSGFGVEEITSKPDLGATTLSKFPLYAEIEPFMLDEVNVNPDILTDDGCGSSSGNLHLQGQGAARFVSKLQRSKSSENGDVR